MLFTAAIFKDVPEDLILSYDLNIFFTTSYMGPNYYYWFLLFVENLKIS